MADKERKLKTREQHVLKNDPIKFCFNRIDKAAFLMKEISSCVHIREFGVQGWTLGLAPRSVQSLKSSIICSKPLQGDMGRVRLKEDSFQVKEKPVWSHTHTPLCIHTKIQTRSKSHDAEARVQTEDGPMSSLCVSQAHTQQ